MQNPGRGKTEMGAAIQRCYREDQGGTGDFAVGGQKQKLLTIS